MDDTSRSTPASDAVRQAVAQHREALVQSVRRALGVVADAEDIVQHAIERALARSSQVRDPERAPAWVASVVRNAVRDELRRRKTTVRSDERVLAVEDHGEEPPCWCVLAQVEQLKPAYARMLRRIDIDGVRVIDVAAELGITPNNAMVRLHRARRALRDQLASHCGTTSARSCSACGCEERGCCPQPA